MDTSSGAAMTVREMLMQLRRRNYDIEILGATVFDHERGTAGLGATWEPVRSKQGHMVNLNDAGLKHQLYVTAKTSRREMTAAETAGWYLQYRTMLQNFRPDIVLYYGGQPADLLIALEARLRGIPVAFYLANGNYTGQYWCRDIDLILTDSHATADLYKRRNGLNATAIGKFIDPTRVVARHPTRRRVLFINPKLEKGVGIAIQLAVLLEKRRPDIVFEVVESRGAWQSMLTTITAAMGNPRHQLDNVIVTPTTSDMRPVFSRARVLLAPSLWWESGGRIAVEAMLNGIPAIITDRGGLPEMVGDAGLRIRLPEALHQSPYNQLMPTQLLEPVAKELERMFDNQAHYAQLCERAKAMGKKHKMETSVDRLLAALEPLASRQAGDGDAASALRAWHRQGVDELTAGRTEQGQPDPSATPEAAP
jgi:glycosyltransferase involved in cell wall biosynthesis